jgi:chemotaxis protein MotB
MSRRHRRHEDHEEHPSEAWLIALADMMTLLMVTFLMMFAISSLDLKKFQTFKQAFAKGTGTVLPQLPGEGVPTEGDISKEPLAPKEDVAKPQASAWVPNPGGPNDPKPVLDKTKLEVLKKKLVEQVKRAHLQDEVVVANDPRGLVLYVTSGVLFNSGEARLTDQGMNLLKQLGPTFTSIGNSMVIEGHTDSRPINSPAFPSNWELSTARATAVLRNLIEKEHVRDGRLSAMGFADTKPRAKGSSEAALALNRRVDIVVEAPRAAPSATPGPTPTSTKLPTAGLTKALPKVSGSPRPSASASPH